MGLRTTGVRRSPRCSPPQRTICPTAGSSRRLASRTRPHEGPVREIILLAANDTRCPTLRPSLSGGPKEGNRSTPRALSTQPRKVQTSPHGDGELRGENVQADHRSNATHEDRRGPGGQEVSNGQGDELAPGPKTRTRRRRRSRASRQGPYRQRLPHSQCLTQQLNGLRRGMLHLKM